MWARMKHCQHFLLGMPVLSARVCLTGMPRRGTDQIITVGENYQWTRHTTGPAATTLCSIQPDALVCPQPSYLQGP